MIFPLTKHGKIGARSTFNFELTLAFAVLTYKSKILLKSIRSTVQAVTSTCCYISMQDANLSSATCNALKSQRRTASYRYCLESALFNWRARLDACVVFPKTTWRIWQRTLGLT